MPHSTSLQPPVAAGSDAVRGIGEQLAILRAREGDAAALDYARRTLEVYRAAIRQRGQRRHHCHWMPFRPHFVRAVLELRALTRASGRDTG